jgi:hypothetical protein
LAKPCDEEKRRVRRQSVGPEFGFDDSMRERGNNQTVRDFVDARVAPHLGVDELIESVVHHQDARADADDRGGELAAPVGVLRDDAKAGRALLCSDARNRANSIGTARERLASGETGPEAEGGCADERGGHG